MVFLHSDWIFIIVLLSYFFELDEELNDIDSSIGLIAVVAGREEVIEAKQVARKWMDICTSQLAICSRGVNISLYFLGRQKEHFISNGGCHLNIFLR